MAIQEFSSGPQNYFEPGYFNGDYTEPNVSRAFLQCDIDNIRGGRFVTGEYYLGNYIDGSYYHDNSIRSSLVCSALKVKVAKIVLGDYYSTGYFTDGYFARTGLVFSINCVAGVQIPGQAQISASASTSTTAGRINQFAIALTATFTQTGTISHIEGADLFAFSNAQLEAAVRRIRDNNITASAVFSVATDATRIRNTAGDDSAQFSFTATTVRSRDYESVQSAAFSLAANTFRIKSLAGTINSEVTLACTISHIEGADLVAFANAAVSTDAVVTKSVSSTQTATFTQDTNNSRLRDHSASQSAAFAFSASIDNRTRDQSSAISSAFAITAIISHTKNFNLTGIASGEFTSNTIGNRIRFGLSSFNGEFVQIAAARKIRDAHLTGTGIAAIVCDAVKTSRASSSQSSQFTQIVVIGKRQSAGAYLAVYASIFVSRNVGLTRNRPFNLEGYAGDTLTFDTSIKKFGSASLNSRATINNKPIIPSATEDFYIETWAYWPTGSETGTFISTVYFVTVGFENTNKLRIYFEVPNSPNSYPSPGYVYVSSNNAIARDVWHHIAIVKTQTSMSYYLNGNRVYNITAATIPDGFYGPNNGNYWGSNMDSPPQTNDQFSILANRARVDEVLFVRNSTYGYSPSSTTIDVPTQARVNSSNVQLLYHFNNNGFDDLSLIQTADSAIQSQATLLAAVGYRANFYSNVSVSSNVVAVVGKLNEINLIAFTNAATTANVNVFKGYNAECSASASISVTAFRIKQLQADLTAAVTVASTPNRLRDTAVALSSSVAVTAQVNAIRNGVAGISANSTITAVIGKLNQIDLVAFANGTITATAVKNTVGQSSITGAFTQTASVVKTTSSASNQSAQFSQNANGSAVRNAVISTQAVSSQLSAVVRLAGLFADDLCEFNVTTVGRRIASAQSSLQSQSQTTVTSVNIKQLSSALQSSATVTANAVVVKIAGGSFSSNFAQSASGNRIRFSAMSAVVVSQVIAVGNATGKIECTLVNAVTLTATVKKMVGVASTLPSAIATVTATANRRRNTSSAVTATSAISVSVQTVITVSAIFATVASQLSVVIEIAGLQAAMSTVATMTVQGQRNRVATAAIQANSQFTAQGGYRSNFGAALSANSSMTANAGYRVNAVANIASALTFVVTVREIRLDTIVYVVPGETRLYAIKRETRIHKIRQETRIYTI